jgi:hypothetical protein
VSNILYTEKLSVIHCAECAMAFAVPERFETDRRRDHKTFHCPIGHHNFFGAESDVERANRLLREAEIARIEADAARNRAQMEAKTAQRKLARVKHRVANGVCPCCTRTFTNLARHMASKHPDQVTK